MINCRTNYASSQIEVIETYKQLSRWRKNKEQYIASSSNAVFGCEDAVINICAYLPPQSASTIATVSKNFARAYGKKGPALVMQINDLENREEFWQYSHCAIYLKAGFSLPSILEKCTKVTKVNLSGNRLVVREILEKFPKIKGPDDFFAVSRIESMRLMDSDINDNDLEFISNKFGLRNFSLFSCPNVTDNGMADIAIGCPSIRLLSVSGCSNQITNTSINQFNDCCMKFVHLKL